MEYPVVTGLEARELGHPTGSPHLHLAMTAKRRHKLQVLGGRTARARRCTAAGRRGLIVGWGSTQGPIHEAVEHAAPRRKRLGPALEHLFPLPNGLEKIFDGFTHIRVGEMNDEGVYGFGQLAVHSRARYCDPKILSLNKADGLTFEVREIIHRVRETVADG